MSDPEGATRERRFTLEEANAMLPELREALERMRDARQVILRSAERVQAAAARDGGGPEGQEYSEAMRSLKSDVERFSNEGIILRDVETGLVDFPATRDGRLVYLCWKLGEDVVGFWHDVDTGFPGRRAL